MWNDSEFWVTKLIFMVKNSKFCLLGGVADIYDNQYGICVVIIQFTLLSCLNVLLQSMLMMIAKCNLNVTVSFQSL